MASEDDNFRMLKDRYDELQRICRETREQLKKQNARNVGLKEKLERYSHELEGKLNSLRDHFDTVQDIYEDAKQNIEEGEHHKSQLKDELVQITKETNEIKASLARAQTSEVGYLLLEDCTIEIVGYDPSTCKNLFPNDKWIDVMTAGSDSEDGPTESDRAYCSRCHLVLHTEDSKDGGRLYKKLVCRVDQASRFDGTINDCIRDRSRCAEKCTAHSDTRSDAALLLGMALAAQDNNHISIHRVQVLLKGERKTSPHIINGIDGSHTKHTPATCSQKAALVITCTIPQLASGVPGNRSILSSLSSKTKSRRSGCRKSMKPLPASTQLLLSIIRSDWEWLKHRMVETEKGSSMEQDRFDEVDFFSRMKTLSFFPPKLALEDLFLRIQGTAKKQAFDETHDSLKRRQNSQCMLVNLPLDVLLANIVPFFRARSLHALRSCCWYFYNTLNAVVPGLKLRLYTHQVKSLNWMRMREARQWSEADFVYGSKSVDCPDGDIHRSVTGGATCLLSSRQTHGSLAGLRLHLDQSSGGEVDLLNGGKGILTRRVTRGGLLCDDPGLGKTITVLSLILQTIGMSTEKLERDGCDEPSRHNTRKEKSNDDENSDESIFQAYWLERIEEPFRRPLLQKIIIRMLKLNDSCHFPFKTILTRIDTGGYSNFTDFHEDVKNIFRNAKQGKSPDDDVYAAACHLEEVYDTLERDMKAEQLKSAKKKFANTSAKPNSSVAVMLEQKERRRFFSSLVPSSATLLVVPSVLMEHWQEQLDLHVDLSYTTSKKPKVFVYCTSKKINSQMEQLVWQSKVDKTHLPLVFLDKAGTKPLPPPEFLAMFSVVITTTRRFTNEWKNGSFQDELRRRSGSEISFFGSDDDQEDPHRQSEEVCSLLKVHWLRLIVDEGHSMGRGKTNACILFASWIAAERRWVMTGTPTRQTSSQSGLSNVRGLMHFLQHEFFSPRLSGDKVWQNMIVRSWNNGNVASFFRLKSLLSLLMVRHTKLDIEELPPPKFNTKIQRMSDGEVATYNTLVCGVQANLLVTGMAGRTSGRQDSLLHRSQARHAKDALKNIRLVCCGGTRVRPILRERLWNETTENLKACQLTPHKMQVALNFLKRVTSMQLSSCMKCGNSLSILLLFPCGCFACTECFDGQKTSCPVCESKFDVDQFQKLQPGFDIQWVSNLKPSEHKKDSYYYSSDEDDEDDEDDDGDNRNDEDNDNRKGPDNLFHGLASGIALRRVQVPDRPTKKPGDGHECEYSPNENCGRCILCLKEHNLCNLTNNQMRCMTCYRKGKRCPKKESKAFYIINKILAMHEDRKQHSKAKPLKVIVFSQFRSALNMVGHRCLQRFGTACVAEYWGSYRKAELRKFTHSSECFCMLLSKDGSEGLDLSFVTHIFFLEELWDQALMNQAVARAWRMGATGRVEVETIIAEESVEETMRQFEHNAVAASSDNEVCAGDASIMEHFGEESDQGKVNQQSKVSFLLRNLKLISPRRPRPLQGMASTGSSISSPSHSLTSGGSKNQERSIKETVGEAAAAGNDSKPSAIRDISANQSKRKSPDGDNAATGVRKRVRFDMP